MSKLTFDDFNFPPTERTYPRLIGKIMAHESVQAAAATATLQIWIADFAGLIGDAYAVATTAAGVGESMVFDIKRNGSTIMTTPLTYGGAGATAQPTDVLSMKSGINQALNVFVPGDVFTIVRTYTAGGAATPIANTKVVIEPTVRNWV